LLLLSSALPRATENVCLSDQGGHSPWQANCLGGLPAVTPAGVQGCERAALEKLLRDFACTCRTVLRFEIPKRSETVLDLGDDYKVAAPDDLLAKIEQLFGERVAVLR
jgi:hypothetical protein